MMELGSADLVFLCFVFGENRPATVFALKRTSLGSVFRLRSSVFRREFAEFSKA